MKKINLKQGIIGLLLTLVTLLGGNAILGGYTDSELNADVTIDAVHAMLHDGRHYYVCGYDTLADGASTTFTVVPDENWETHLTFKVESNNILTAELYEGITTTTAGTAATIFNSKRDSSRTSEMQVFKNAMASSTYATKISEAKFGANTNKVQFGGGLRREDEIILDSDKIYYIKFISGAADNIVSYCGDWYEVQEF